MKGDVSLPVFTQVAKTDISSVAPYGICRFFDGNPYTCNTDDMLYLINASKSFFTTADSDGTTYVYITVLLDEAFSKERRVMHLKI